MFGYELGDYVEDLFLYDYVECGGWFVCDDDFGIVGEGYSDYYVLFLVVGEFMWV